MQHIEDEWQIAKDQILEQYENASYDDLLYYSKIYANDLRFELINELLEAPIEPSAEISYHIAKNLTKQSGLFAKIIFYSIHFFIGDQGFKRGIVKIFENKQKKKNYILSLVHEKTDLISLMVLMNKHGWEPSSQLNNMLLHMAAIGHFIKKHMS